MSSTGRNHHVSKSKNLCYLEKPSGHPTPSFHLIFLTDENENQKRLEFNPHGEVEIIFVAG